VRKIGWSWLSEVGLSDDRDPRGALVSFDSAARFLLAMPPLTMFEQSDAHGAWYRCKGCQHSVRPQMREAHHAAHVRAEHKADEAAKVANRAAAVARLRDARRKKAA
jgi:hypothetical protein